jgi:hypothetical protein
MTDLTKADLTRLTPIEIDTELARLWGDESDTAARIASYHGYIRSALRCRDGSLRNRADVAPWVLKDIEGYEATIVELTAKLAEIRAEATPYTDEFTRRGGWLRYFLVTNTNGHVHREMNCSTCYPTTRYAWLIDLADCDEDAMIEEWGEKACTCCFPSAPTNPLYHRPARIDREAKAARDAEKLARETAKNAKAIFDPATGGPLKIYDGTYTNYRTGVVEERFETIKTKIAARNALSGAVHDLAWYGTDGGNGDTFLRKARELKAALEPTEIDTDKIIANALKRAKKDGAAHLAAAEKLTETL